MSLTYEMYCKKCDKETEHKFDVVDSGEVIAVCECGNNIQYWQKPH